LFLKTDGAGNLSFDSLSFSTPLAVIGNATSGSEIRLPEDTDNGANYIAIKAPDTIASNLTLTLPSADGTSGQVLQTNGSGVLSFAGVSVAGTIVSVNEAIDTTQRDTSSASFVDLSSNLTITVTPSSSSNKFLILTDLWCRGDGNETYTTIFRGATNLGDATRGLTANPIQTDYTRSPLLFLDSPNTTSSTTYKLQFKAVETTFRLNYDANSRARKSRMIILEIKG
jgi:hypothetical protein